ncbi:hypothetical protein BU16DRAFT_612506 [Lophium mytilinum]|uniref:CENP-V/GFA domain-containing protein n=1 Tax=Lophium mytilinum TaxID=390894 RepID=A0A6A6REZ6_9PEZI|nr:hypothetical protein BU16DRAFT_612506 [Lophium mytilinum]
MSAPAETSTRVYNGSCHCGATQYLVRLTFPPILDINAKSIRIYKCNCSTCTKMNLFHLRPIDPASDFLVLSPNPETDLGDYRTFKKVQSWYFCKECGVRCFGIGGEWETTEVDLDKWKGNEGSEGKTTKAWKLKAGEWKYEHEGKEVVRPSCYLSVNAVTVEPDQEGFSLKEWHEKGWITYVDARHREGGPKVGEPYKWGSY